MPCSLSMMKLLMDEPHAGPMMTEIGLAQRRLFDDDAPYSYAKQEIPPTASFTEGSSMPAYPGEHLQEPYSMGGSGFNYAGQYTEGDPAQHHIPAWYHAGLQTGDVHANGLDQPQFELINGDYYSGETHSLSTEHPLPSNSSYNLFESSLAADNPTAQSNETIPTDVIDRTPHRSKSMQVANYSSRDTEPFSSAIPLNVSRSRSDIVGQHSTPQEQQQQHMMKASDGPSAPVANEIPTAQKKRGRKKKQEGDADNELAAAPNGRQAAHEGRAKKNPGRPRKNTQDLSKNELSETSEQIETKEPPVPDEPKPTDNTPHDNDQVQHVQINVSDNHPTEAPMAEEQVRFAELEEPPKPPKTKEPKKKKLKRGKTTSVTLQKTYQPDVEDDVIWVDERPSKPSGFLPEREGYQMQPMSIPTPDSISVAAEEPATMATVGIPTSNNPVPTEGEEHQGQDVQAKPQPEPVPAPMKRERKRKKTSERPSESADAPTETGTNGQTSAQDNQPATTPQLENNLSIVLDAPTNAPESKYYNLPATEQASEPASNPEPYAEEQQPPQTPGKQQNPFPNTNGQPNTDSVTSTTGNPNNNKGPSKHSPIAGTSKVPYRVGLSRRARIAPLLKVIRR